MEYSQEEDERETRTNDHDALKVNLAFLNIQVEPQGLDNGASSQTISSLPWSSEHCEIVTYLFCNYFSMFQSSSDRIYFYDHQCLIKEIDF